MTLIIHRCTACRHPDCYHTGTDECCWGHCRSGRHPMTPGPSECLMTYAPDGHVITTVIEPGSLFGEFGRYPLTTCDCPNCWALYRTVWGGAA